MAGALDAFNANRRASLQDTQGLFDQAVTRRAGGLLASGDYTGAAGALYGGGLLSEGSQVQAMGQQQQDKAYARAKDARTEAKAISVAEQAERLKFLAHGAEVLLSIPQEQRADAYTKSIAPALKAMGAPDDVIAKGGTALDDNSLRTFGAEAKKKAVQITNLGNGYAVATDETGKVVKEYRGPLVVDPGKNVYMPGADPAAAPAVAPTAGPAPATDKLFDALIVQESGGRPGVIGPQTDYGRAEGMTQMLPATAKEMADKLGVPWKPDLMRGKTPEAAAYQTQLGRAYFEEGLQKYGGDPAKALMYYHGGPDEKLWGPKTRAYAGEVLARAGGSADDALAGGGGADRIAPDLPGYSRVQTAEVKPGKGAAAPAGYKWADDGSLTFIPGGPADPKTARDKKPPTMQQDNAASFTYRTLGANDRLNALADQGIFKPATVTAQLVRETDGVTRIVARSDIDRQFIQASKDWLAPILRKDTGAAVTDAELATYMDIYIPKYEDSQAVMKQKALARQDAMVALAKSAGDLYGERFGDRTFAAKYPSATKKRDVAAGSKPRPPLASIFGSK